MNTVPTGAKISYAPFMKMSSPGFPTLDGENSHLHKLPKRTPNIYRRHLLAIVNREISIIQWFRTFSCISSYRINQLSGKMVPYKYAGSVMCFDGMGSDGT